MTPKSNKDQPSGFVNRLEKIAIVGAGGRLGTYITQALLATGKHTLTAITRAETTSTTKLPQGVVTAKVPDYGSNSNNDKDNEAAALALVEALRGQHCLIITLSVLAAPGTQSRLVKAAAEAGVPYVIPNQWGYDTGDGEVYKDLGPLATAFRQICNEIEALGVSKWIGVANGFWYEFSLGGTPDRFGFDFAKRTVDLIDDGDTKINTTTFPQVGRAVAALLSLPVLPDDDDDDKSPATAAAAAAAAAPFLSRWDNDLVFVSSFRVSQRDMLASAQRVTGTTDADWAVRREDHRRRYDGALEGLRRGHMSSFVRAMYTRVFFPDGAGDYEGPRGTANAVLGLPREDLDEATKIAIERGLAGVL